MVKINRPMNVFEKLQAGWWWCGQIFEEWWYTIKTQNDEDWEFFNYLQTDYCKYEGDTYYVVTKTNKTCSKRAINRKN